MCVSLDEIAEIFFGHTRLLGVQDQLSGSSGERLFGEGNSLRDCSRLGNRLRVGGSNAGHPSWRVESSPGIRVGASASSLRGGESASPPPRPVSRNVLFRTPESESAKCRASESASLSPPRSVIRGIPFWAPEAGAVAERGSPLRATPRTGLKRPNHPEMDVMGH